MLFSNQPNSITLSWFGYLKNVILGVLVLLLSIPGISHGQETDQHSKTTGKFLGAKQTTHPDWFKESFLDFEEDIEEAASNGKRLILYFHQDGCPYCNQLVEHNFKNEIILEKVQTNFDLVAINMWGDKEVIQVGGRSFTEKTLAAALSVNFTPTLLFFSEDKKVALRLDGYHPPEQFVHALNYVATQQEKKSSYPNYLAKIKQADGAHSLPQFERGITPPYKLNELDKKPLAVIFEEPNCESCDLLHQRTFTNPSAAALLDQFNLVRLNRWSDTTVTKPDGNLTTAFEWANELGLGFSPSIVFFDQQGKKVMTIDAMFKTFHTLGVFDYVSSKAYETEPSFQRYLNERAEHIRSKGKDVNIWSY